MIRAEPKAPVKRRGRPPSGKVVVTMRLDPDVVERFKATGAGWQARMNEALTAHVDRPALDQLEEHFLAAYDSWRDSLVEEDGEGRPLADLIGDRLFQEFLRRARP